MPVLRVSNLNKSAHLWRRQPDPCSSLARHFAFDFRRDRHGQRIVGLEGDRLLSLEALQPVLQPYLGWTMDFEQLQSARNAVVGGSLAAGLMLQVNLSRQEVSFCKPNSGNCSPGSSGTLTGTRI